MSGAATRVVLAGVLAVSIGTFSIAAEIAPAERKSGYDFMTRDTQNMQDDDTVNSGMLWVLEGEALWNRKSGSANKSCADCHSDARASMKGVAARYPAFDAVSKRPVNLDQRINMCRVERQQASPLRYESRELLALSAYLGRQSRGAAAAPPADERLKPFIAAGREMFMRRQGQLNLGCANCHDDNWGKKLAGAVIPQAHPTGYPIYRLEWQGLGSLQRRLRNCLTGMRADAFDYGAPEYVDLELYLMTRARGMPMEAPAVRP